MSHRAISGQQFAGQLQMFMTPNEVVEKVHKGDTNWPGLTPREQWEAPQTGAHEESLRQTKLGNLSKEEKRWRNQPYETMPPLHIVHQGAKSSHRPGMHLWDGHHRLALAERRGHSYVAVMHHTEDEWDEY